MSVVRAAAGNRFATWNVDLGAAPHEGSLVEAAAMARALCLQESVDGVIAFARAQGASDLRLVFFNADGSRPEACGNGLRTAARFAREKGWVSSDEMCFETDAGPRTARLLREAGEVRAAEVSLGLARDHGDLALVLPEIKGAGNSAHPGSPDRGALEVSVAHIELGNPHAVLFVDDPSSAAVATLGPRIERHERFPERINVGFAGRIDVGLAGGTPSGSALALRVWERGVGETQACGTGAAAAALAAVGRDRATWPVAVDLPGGRLVVRAGTNGELWLTGPC